MRSRDEITVDLIHYIKEKMGWEHGDAPLPHNLEHDIKCALEDMQETTRKETAFYQKYYDRDVSKVRMWNRIRKDILHGGQENTEKIRFAELRLHTQNIEREEMEKAGLKLVN